MKKFLVFSGLALFVVIGCNKDKFQTKPQLSLKSINSNIVANSGTLNMILGYTDKEGDVQDTLYMVRTRLNKKGFAVKDPTKLNLPVFPNNQEGEIQLTLPEKFYLSADLTAIPTTGTNKEIDTLVLKFVLGDKAGNKSDTLVVPDIYVIR